MQVDKSRFNTKATYEAALRDAKLIDELKSKYNLSKKDDIFKLYQLLLSGNLKFESLLGNDFDDEVYELYKKAQKSEFDNSGKKQKTVKNKSELKKDNTKNSKKSSNISLDDFDDNMKKQIQIEMKKRDRRRRFSIFIFGIVAISCIGYYFFYYYKGKTDDDSYKDIEKLKNSESLKSDKTPTTVTATLSNDEKKVLTVLPKYETLYNSNKRLIGWLKIDDTIIDYPVMQCDDNTYYLNHNFNQEESKAGALFLDYQCDVVNGSDNYIIYGHHLSSGGMFSKLSEYQSQSYYNKHKYIKFDTIYEEQTFQVMYVFRSRVYDSSEVVFKYYQFINANSAEEFYSYMDEMKAEAFYDTGVSAVYGDQLLTLSTCDYNEKNGRFVVVAKRIY